MQLLLPCGAQPAALQLGTCYAHAVCCCCFKIPQEAVLRRWAPMPEDNRAVVAAVATMVDPDADWQQQQEEGIEALRHALDGIGELWHSSIVEPSAGSGAAAEGPLAFLLRRATQECEKAAAALETSPEQVSSQDLRSPLSLLAAGRIGGSPLKVSGVGGWTQQACRPGV